MNHNQLLGVSPDASSGEIQSAFRSAAMELHPDHNNSPEAAESFARIKEARDELMKRAQAAEAARDDDSIRRSTAHAVQATARASFVATSPVDDNLFDGMTPEEVAHVQKLDDLIRQKPKRSAFGRIKESAEVRRHRRKIDTLVKRSMGKY